MLACEIAEAFVRLANCCALALLLVTYMICLNLRSAHRNTHRPESMQF